MLSSSQRGDSAVILATVGYRSETLEALVEAGSDLNLFNEVRYTRTLHHILSTDVLIIEWVNSIDDICEKWQDKHY